MHSIKCQGIRAGLHQGQIEGLQALKTKHSNDT